MLRGKLEKVIEDRNYYKEAYQNLEKILQEHGIDITSSESIAKDLLAFKSEKEEALGQLHKRSIELEAERKKVRNVILIERDLLVLKNERDVALAKLEKRTNELEKERKKIEKILIQHQEEIAPKEEDAQLFKDERDETLAQLKERTIELNKERKKMKKILIKRQEKISKVNNNMNYDDNFIEEKKSHDIPSDIGYDSLDTYINAQNYINYKQYLQRIASELTVNGNKGLNEHFLTKNGTTNLKQSKLSLQKQLLYGINHRYAFDSSFFSNSQNSTGANACYDYLPIINPYSTSSTQSNTITKNKYLSKVEQEKFNNSIFSAEEYYELHINQLALDIALSQINEMDEQLTVVSQYNKKLHSRVLALEKNVSYSWREYA